MKVIGLFQFYFPYVLPRDPNSPEISIGAEYHDFVVLIHPRGLEEKLFPNEIDEILSTMELTVLRISQPTGGGTIVTRDRCFDRIEIQVQRDIDSPEEIKQDEIQKTFFEVAVQACNRFLNHCRVVARTPFIRGIEREYRVKDGKFYTLTPRTICWLNGEDWTLLAAPEALAGAVRSPESGVIDMPLLQKSLQAAVEPSLPLSLIVDAKEYLGTVRLREAVMALGTACEIAYDEYIQRKGEKDKSLRKVIRAKDPTFAEWRYHLVPNHLNGRSLKNEDSKTFDLVEKNYKTRNKLAHEGRLYYLDAGVSVLVDEHLIADFIMACEKAVDWIAVL